jgi:hypothetical protein
VGKLPSILTKYRRFEFVIINTHFLDSQSVPSICYFRAGDEQMRRILPYLVVDFS